MMIESYDSEDVDVEDRIVGEFMTRLQNSDVDFDIVEVMEGLIDEDDFGGEEEIVARIKEVVLEHED